MVIFFSRNNLQSTVDGVAGQVGLRVLMLEKSRRLMRPLISVNVELDSVIIQLRKMEAHLVLEYLYLLLIARLVFFIIGCETIKWVLNIN